MILSNDTPASINIKYLAMHPLCLFCSHDTSSLSELRLFVFILKTQQPNFQHGKCFYFINYLLNIFCCWWWIQVLIEKKIICYIRNVLWSCLRIFLSLKFENGYRFKDLNWPLQIVPFILKIDKNCRKYTIMNGHFFFSRKLIKE